MVFDSLIQYTTPVTNVPVPSVMAVHKHPIHPMLVVFPIAFLPKDHALAIAIMSYNGQMNFGLLGDYDAMPDLDEFGEAIEASLASISGRTFSNDTS